LERYLLGSKPAEPEGGDPDEKREAQGVLYSVGPVTDPATRQHLILPKFRNRSPVNTTQ